MKEDNARLYELKMANGEIDMTVSGRPFSNLVEMLYQTFKQNGSTNFFTTSFGFNKDSDHYEMIIQKISGISTAEKLSAMRNEIDQLKAENAQLTKQLKIEKRMEDLAVIATDKQKPSLGLKPKYIHDAGRLDDIKQSISRYLTNKTAIPAEWIEEYNELINGGNQ